MLTFPTVLGSIGLHGVTAVTCISTNERPPYMPIQLRIRETNKWRPSVIWKLWALPKDMVNIAMYQRSYTAQRSLVVQPVLTSAGDRKFHLILMDAVKGFDGGEYTLIIPNGEDNCVADLGEQNMDIKSVAVW